MEMFEKEERQKKGEKHPSEYLRGKVKNGLMRSLFSTNKQKNFLHLPTHRKALNSLA